MIIINLKFLKVDISNYVKNKVSIEVEIEKEGLIIFIAYVQRVND